MTFLFNRLGLTMVLAGLLAFSGHVLAQEIKDERGVPIGERKRPDYDPQGIRLGSFVATPILDLGLEFDSNIFAQEDDPESDFIALVAPSLVVESDWGRHRLSFKGSGEIIRYFENTSENVDNYELLLAGALDITRDSQLSAGAGVEQAHEDRGSPDDENGAEPTPVFSAGGQAQFYQRFNRVSATLYGSGRHLNYQDVPSIFGGEIDNDDRDRAEYETSLRVGYDMNPRIQGFVEGAYNTRIYDQTPDNNGFDRDNHGFDVNAGIALDLTGLVFGELFAGYYQQSYEDNAFDTDSGFSYGANLTWNATPLISVHLGASQAVQETTLTGASGFNANAIDLSVDYELLRNVIIAGDLGGGLNDYNGIDRDDYFFGVGLGATYLINRYSNIELAYSFFSRDSNVPTQSYDRHEVGLILQLQY